MLEDIHISTMQPLVGSHFILTDSSGQEVDLTLIAVDVKEDSPTMETFSLCFTGPQQPFLQQGTYHLHSAPDFDCEMFMVPIARKTQGFEYEAVFNLIRQPAEKKMEQL